MLLPTTTWMLALVEFICSFQSIELRSIKSKAHCIAVIQEDNRVPVNPYKATDTSLAPQSEQLIAQVQDELSDLPNILVCQRASWLISSLPAPTLPKKAGQAFPQTWKAKTDHYSVLITVMLHITKLSGFFLFYDKALAYNGLNSSINPGHSLFISDVWTIAMAPGYSFNSCLSVLYVPYIPSS